MSQSRLSLSDLERADEFTRRHIGPDDAEIAAMLEVVGAASLDELIDRATPRSIRSARPLDLPPARSETEALAALRTMAGRNRVVTSMIGMGYYGTVTPAVILRNVLENPGWYTAYTPYQAEIAQGRLEALLELPADGRGPHRPGARQRLAARRGDRGRRGHGDGQAASARAQPSAFFVAADCHPQTIAVLRTRAEALRLRGRGRRPAERPRRPARSSARCSSTRARAARCATSGR